MPPYFNKESPQKVHSGLSSDLIRKNNVVDNANKNPTTYFIDITNLADQHQIAHQTFIVKQQNCV